MRSAHRAQRLITLGGHDGFSDRERCGADPQRL